ncbi:MAG: hypothetical protein ACF8MF_14220 [Phycisphaerales bacterium JB052]
MSTPLSPSQAKLWTIGAQAGSLICVLGAVAVGMVGLPEHTPGVTLEQAKVNAQAFKPPPVTTPDSMGEYENADASVDTMGLAERLALLDNAPEPQVEVVEPAEPTDENTTDPGPTLDEATIARRVKYIGFINDARTPRAFIRIDGKQRIVSLGEVAQSNDEALPDLEVERITPRLIILRDGESRAAIDLASKTGPSITLVEGDEIEVAATPVDPTKLTPEEEAMIQSLPVRQQQMARRRLEREKRGLPPENENRRPTPEPLVTIRGNVSETGRQPDVRRRGGRDNN